MRKRVAAAASTAVLMCVLVGCAPEGGEPTPTPTPAFASEEEAFAAAEETYRAYVDALNQVDLSDPATFEPVYELTTGDLNASERKNLTRMSADDWSVTGTTFVARLEPLEASPSRSEVQLGACTDVSGVQLSDAQGQSVIAADRPPIQSVRVTLSSSASSPTGYLVADVVGFELEPSCTG